MIKPTITVRDVKIFKGFVAPNSQRFLLGNIENVVQAAPLFTPVTRNGASMSVRMTSAGKFGWFSDRRGYRYETRHPTGVAWPEIPPAIIDIWAAITGVEKEPNCCLINYYSENSKMGMHQDRDEADFTWPVVSISLGDDALFRIGNIERGGTTQSIWLQSGDVLVIGGSARLVHHGVGRIRFGTSQLLAGGGRINLTLRVVD